MSAESASQSSERRSSRVCALVQVETCERHDIQGDKVSIGRNEDNQLCLKNDVFVSGHHAEIHFDDDGCWLKDLDSRNGTTKNGDPVTAPVKILPGDFITIGRTRFKVE
ncbi:MAG TPA: FHA domain-containing protein [Candidatus Obscuribacterales bacterium]